MKTALMGDIGEQETASGLQSDRNQGRHSLAASPGKIKKNGRKYKLCHHFLPYNLSETHKAYGLQQRQKMICRYDNENFRRAYNAAAKDEPWV